MVTCNAAITSVSYWFPEDRFTNKDLEQLVDTTGDCILARTGIEERRILRDSEKATAYLATQATKSLIVKCDLNPEPIDLLIVATASPEYQYPETASIVRAEIGRSYAWSFDVNGPCNRFLFALNIACQCIENGTHKKNVVIGADKMSEIANYSDRKTCIQFGDGAAAVILEPDSTGAGIIDSVLKMSGGESTLLYQKSVGGMFPVTSKTVSTGEYDLSMNSPDLMAQAITSTADATQEIITRNMISLESVHHVITHQAKKHIIEEVVKRIGLRMEKAFINIEKYGNTSTATLPIYLSELESDLKRGDNVVMTTFGAGFSWGAMYMKWAYNGNEKSFEE